MDHDDNFILSTKRQVQEEPSYRHSWAIIQTITAFLPSFVFLYALFFLLSILLQSKLKSSFNIYLFFIILPDACLNFIISVSLFWEGSHEGVYAPELCKARNSISFFHYYSNLYLNAAVAREIHILVQKSYQRIRTKPPPLRRVMRQVVAVYTVAAVFVSWCILDVRWSPVAISDLVYCDTSFGSPTEDPVFTFWTSLLVASITLAPPILYVFWVGYRIWSQKLLPIKGRTRAISIFFFRIVIVFFFFYVPSLVLAFTYIGIPEDKQTARFWTLWVFSLLIPTQCFVTLRLASTKDDIGEALRESSRFLYHYAGRSSFFLSPTSSRSSTPSLARITSEWNTDDIYEESSSQILSIERSNQDMSSIVKFEDEGDVEKNNEMEKGADQASVPPSF